MWLLTPWEEYTDMFAGHACNCSWAHIRVFNKHGVVIADPEILQVSDIEVLVEIESKAFLHQLEV